MKGFPLGIVLAASAVGWSSQNSAGVIRDLAPSASDPLGAASVVKEACTAAKPGESYFADISDSSGIRKNNFVLDPAKPIPINDHSRLAFADLDGDGRDDIVMHSLFPNALKGIPFEHIVLLNQGDKTFRDFSDESGLRRAQAAFFSFADVDNDGDQDCFAGLDIALTEETSALYLNEGSGHFEKREDSGLEKSILTANGVFGDFNGDGKLDLYAGNGGTTNAVADQLFLGNGDGTFSDASTNLQKCMAQPTNGVVACDYDYDNDGDLDVFVSHYGVSIGLGWNALWENDGTGVFENVARQRGFHALATGNYFLQSTGKGRDSQPGDAAQIVGSNGFGIDCQDIDGDGNMDIWIAAISHPDEWNASRKWSDPSQLLINQGPAKDFVFENQFLDRGLPFNEGDIDAAAVDFDNDGRMDLSVTRDRKYEANYSAVDQKSWFGLFHQGDDGRFASVGPFSGINDMTGATDRLKAGQNHAWADIEGDGDCDLLVGGRDNGGRGRANFLFENQIGHRNSWVGVRLRGDGVKVNRDAIGARVTITVGERRIVRDVRSARGTYSSADGRALLFGLGDSADQLKVSMEVRWPNGHMMRFDPGRFGLNQYLTIDYVLGLVP